VVSFLALATLFAALVNAAGTGAIFAHVSVTDSSFGTRKRLFSHTAARSP
jgi:hypothetical protein